VSRRLLFRRGPRRPPSNFRHSIIGAPIELRSCRPCTCQHDSFSALCSNSQGDMPCSAPRLLLSQCSRTGHLKWRGFRSCSYPQNPCSIDCTLNFNSLPQSTPTVVSPKQHRYRVASFQLCSSQNHLFTLSNSMLSNAGAVFQLLDYASCDHTSPNALTPSSAIAQSRCDSRAGQFGMPTCLERATA
jgi:hypothetical protein